MLIKHGDAKILDVVKDKDAQEKTASEILEESLKKDSSKNSKDKKESK